MSRLSLAIIASTAIVTACAGAAEAPRLKVRYFVTDMSVVGPELHIVLENQSSQYINTRIDAVDLECGRADDLSVSGDARGTVRREHPWSIRREMFMTSASTISPRGFAHRVFAFGHVEQRALPCDVKLEIRSGNQIETIDARIDHRDLAEPFWKREIPKVKAWGWVSRDMISDRRLMHVVVESKLDRSINVAVLGRTIECPSKGLAEWDLVQDVPQGMSAGPARLDPDSGVVFQGVIVSGEPTLADRCTIEVKLGVEVTPTAFVTLEDLRVPMSLHPGFGYVR